MAEKRMFSKSCLESDEFLNLSLKAQYLFLHLSLNADDDGIVDNSTSIIRLAAVPKASMTELIKAKQVLDLGEGIFIIRDWHLHNYIRESRRKKSAYTELLKKVALGEDGRYSLTEDEQMSVYCQQVYGKCTANDGQKTDTCPQNDAQKRIVENRPEQNRGEENSIDVPTTLIINVVSYLNEVTGKKFNCDSPEYEKLISGLVKRGYSENDLKRTINNMATAWKGTTFESGLNPRKLFGEKFDTFLNWSADDELEEEKPKRKETAW